MISEKDAENLARLSRLVMSKDFVPVVTKHLNSLLGYMERLNKIDTTQIEAMSHVHGSTNVFREDALIPVQEVSVAIGETKPLTAQPTLDIEALKKNVPDKSGRFIRVPLVIE